MDKSDASGMRAASAPRRVARASCAAAAAAVALLVAVGAYAAVYLALDGEPPSTKLVLHRVPVLICTMLPGCARS